MENYVDYEDEGDTEERVQVSQATCDREEEIEEAIERSKRQLKKTKMPYGYEKLDEEIITTVYKIPGNEIVHECRHSNIEEINENIINEKIVNRYNTSKSNYNNYNNSYNEENKTKKYNYKNIDGGKIENFFQNEISKDGNYLVSMTFSKKTIDKNKYGKGRGRYQKNFYKEEIEVDENDEGGDYQEYYNRGFRPRNKFKLITNNHAHSLHFPADYKKGEFNKYNY